MVFGKEWSELKRFEKLDAENRQIIFYSENLASKNHIGPLIDELTKKFKQPICYVSSVPNDPYFLKNSDLIKTFFIGDGMVRTKFFLTLQAKILIMDMPDLESFHIKKSKVYPVHYIYVFHSLFSTHTYLRKNALDNFDTIFCVNEHHVNEIRTAEKKYNLKPKILLNYGFPRVDYLVNQRSKINDKKVLKSILITPSYGKSNLLEMCGEQLINLLLKQNFNVILRPHFKTLKENKILLEKLREKFSHYENFYFLDGVITNKIFNESLILISDWSGISFEYALAFEKPVIFIDVPQKIINLNYDDLGIEPIELIYREKFGRVISPNDIECIINFLHDSSEHQKIKKSIVEYRSKIIFNLGNSATIGSIYIKKLLENLNKINKIN